MENNDRIRIQGILEKYVQLKGSQKKAANSLSGVSSATINKILAGNWEDISAEMWRNVYSQIAGTGELWNLAETSVYKRMHFVLKQAQRDNLVMSVVGNAGCGKTQSIRAYNAKNRNVFHVVCMEHLNRKSFVGRLLKALGLSAGGGNIADMLEDVVNALGRMEAPVVVLDEADKLSDQVLYFFISLYNSLEGKCGLVLCGTHYLKSRILRGVRLGKRGYEEIYSRLCRKFVELDSLTDDDVALVCVANGIHKPSITRTIVADGDGDLRRVRRAVWVAIHKASEEEE